MSKNTSHQGIVARIKSGDKSVLSVIYSKYRSEFIDWAKRRYSCSTDEGIEFFQMAVVIMYENVVADRIENPDVNIRSYIFSIAKNKIREWQRSNNRQKDFVEFAQQQFDASEIYSEQELNIVEEALGQLDGPCKEVLTLFYYYKLDMKQIAEKLQYKNTDTSKTMKYKCLQRLRKIVKAELAKMHRDE